MSLLLIVFNDSPIIFNVRWKKNLCMLFLKKKNCSEEVVIFHYFSQKLTRNLLSLDSLGFYFFSEHLKIMSYTHIWEINSAKTLYERAFNLWLHLPVTFLYDWIHRHSDPDSVDVIILMRSGSPFMQSE